MAITKTIIASAAFVLAGNVMAQTSSFIAMTPTEFSEGFNRAAQLYRLKPRMPVWQSKAGKFSASVAPGVSVFGVGVERGDAVSSIVVRCQGGEQCSEAIFAAALSADPDLSVNSLKAYVAGSLNGEMDDMSITSEGLEFMMVASKQKKTITFTITVDDSDDDESE